MIKNNPKSFYAILFLLLTFIVDFMACNPDKSKIDTGNIKIELDFNRFEKDLFELSKPITEGNIHTLRKKYPEFFDVFCQRIIRIPMENDSVTAANLNLFILDKDVMAIYKKTIEVFPELNAVQTELTQMLKYFHYYWPSKPVPDIITYISAFNYQIITTDSAMGVGLDMYLGKDCEFYPALGLPRYMSNKLSKEYLVRDVIKAMFQSEYDPDKAGNEFLQQIVYHGKLLYYTDLLAPEMDDTLKIGYSKKQMEWCRQNEAAIWGFLIENDLLYSKDPSRYIRYINDGNSTQGLPAEAPAKLGAWIGWQITRAYAERHKGLNHDDFFNETDAQKILSGSGYKPAK